MTNNLSSITRKVPALALALPILAALGMLLFSRYTLETARIQKDAARAALAGATAKVSAAEDLLRRDQRAQAQLARLRQQGLDQAIDEFRWHEALGKARQDLHLLALNYELAPERPVAQAAEASSLRTATLRIDAVLRHEEDFLALMRRLEQVGSGLMTRHCRLSLTQESDAPARLQARCELERTYIQWGEKYAGQAEDRSAAPPPAGEATLRDTQER